MTREKSFRSVVFGGENDSAGGWGATMSNKSEPKFEQNIELRRGPWTLEEDSLLVHYITRHGEGRWNHLAKSSGLKRTGKSCRLRWLNYLKPDVKRGNLTLEEQILIIELHCKWGNRWSRIAQQLPGRTDNEIKNYWRTRVQKQARQLNIDANSPVFRNALGCFWSPRPAENDGPFLPAPKIFADPYPYHRQEVLPSASQTVLADVNRLYDSFLSSQALPVDQTQGFRCNPAIISGLCGALTENPVAEMTSSAAFCCQAGAVENGIWSMDELCETRKLN